MNTCMCEVVRYYAVVSPSLRSEEERKIDAWKQKQRDEAKDEIFVRATYEEKFRRFGIPVPVPRKAD